MFPFFYVLLFCKFRYIVCVDNNYVLDKNDDRYVMSLMIMNLTEDVIKHQNEKLYAIRNSRHDHAESAAFEIGYMTQVIQEHYRRMLDKWRTATIDFTKFYNLEIVLFLEEIEHLYWAIKHEVYMLHEIEKKYQIKAVLNESYEDPLYGFTTPYPTPPPEQSRTRPKPKFNPKKLLTNHSQYLFGPYTTRKPRTTRLPRDYGWEPYEWNSDT